MSRWNPKSGLAKAGWRDIVSQRDRLAALLALVTLVCLGAAFLLSRDTQFLMPGPLASVHGAIENCSACHTKTGSGKLSWVHGLVAGDPRADSKSCLRCHKMPKTAFNAHGTSKEMLKESTERLAKIAAGTPAPQLTIAQDIAFPASDVVAGGLNCATCHQEHKGVDFNLNKISNAKCHSCHAVKFDSFDGDHPKFDNYPFKRRTRIIYDHAGHFGKHFPEVTKKEPAKRIPETCSACHDSRDDRRIMAVAPFEKTCSACHLNQIIGSERASGPKGIAFLTLPGLDLQTLSAKHISIGEWPEASEAELTPFMKVMISGDEKGRTLIRAVDSLNLQDLTAASDEQIEAVTQLVWRIKELFFALISGKASDVLAKLKVGNDAKLGANVIADLTANIPRDVIVSAQQDWLPNLAREIADRRKGVDPNRGNWNTAITVDEPAPPQEPSAPDATSSAGEGTEVREAAAIPRRDPPTCALSILGKCLSFKDRKDAPAAGQNTASSDETTGSIGSPDPEEDGAEESNTDSQQSTVTPDEPDGIEEPVAQGEPGDNEDAPASKPARGQSEGAAGSFATAGADGADDKLTSDDPPPKKAANQTDDLLFPTDEERRAMEAAAARAEGSAASAEADSEIPAGDDEAKASSVMDIESDVDPENWADYGGWYRQDYAIFYRPSGHKDKFIYSWLALTGPHAPKGDARPAAAVFDFLTAKDAQGSCTNCHSVDDLQSQGRVVNFFPPSAASKQGRFTSFIHEPHFQAVGIGQRKGVVKNRGCLTCHSLQKANTYLKSYEQGDPQDFSPSFGPVQKNLCLTCHNAGTARQDCLTCHQYHVNGVTTPIMNTKIPSQ